jgi:hypothetical protein
MALEPGMSPPGISFPEIPSMASAATPVSSEQAVRHNAVKAAIVGNFEKFINTPLFFY